MIEADNPDFSSVTVNHLCAWMAYPANLFQTVTYKNGFLGLLFTLKLSPETFEKVMAFEKPKKDITAEDFVPENEKGAILAIAFFSLSTQIATLLMARLFAHFVAHQKRIESFGFLTANPDARTIAEKMELKVTGKRTFDNQSLIAYRNDLFSILRGEAVLKSLFDKARTMQVMPKHNDVK